MRALDKSAFPVLVIAACAGLGFALMLWVLVQTNGPTSMDASKRETETTGSITGGVSNEPAVPAAPAPKNDPAWESQRGIPPGKNR